MPLDSSLVGTTSELVPADVDVAWTMAYAAGLGDAMPCYLDTTRERGIVAHPMFSVAIEWRAMIQIIQVLSEAGFPRAEMLRRVHATDDVIVHRPIRPPEQLFTRATLAGIERRKAGAYQLTRFDTVDEKGAPVCTTWYGNLYRGVEVWPGPSATRCACDAGAVDRRGADACELRDSDFAARRAHLWRLRATRQPGQYPYRHGHREEGRTAGHHPARHGHARDGSLARDCGRGRRRSGARRTYPCALRRDGVDAVRGRSAISARERSTEGKTIFFEVLSADGGRAIRDGFVVLRG